MKKHKISHPKLTTDDIQCSLIDRHFEPYFQPFHDANTGECIGAEVLVRIHHPEYGVLYPGAFLPLIADNAILLAVTEQLMEKVEAVLSKWIFTTPFMLSFNISPEFIINEAFILSCLYFCERKNDKITLMLEVTENKGDCTNGKHYINNFKRLRRNGVKIALDDFGTGHSNFQRLQKTPIDYLKIPKEYVSLMKKQCVSIYLIECIVFLAQRLKIEAIAEGVENKEQALTLAGKGVRFVQGYYFSKPIIGEEFYVYLTSKMNSKLWGGG